MLLYGWVVFSVVSAQVTDLSNEPKGEFDKSDTRADKTEITTQTYNNCFTKHSLFKIMSEQN